VEARRIRTIFDIFECCKQTLRFEVFWKKIYLIAGNHDYHLLKLKANDYPFEFLSNLVPLPSVITTTGNKKYIFRHGWEFDHAQHPTVMEAMCFNLSDAIGDYRSDIYNLVEKSKDDVKVILKDIINFHGGDKGYVQHLLQPPEDRLKPYLGDVEKTAAHSIKGGETLIFGYTHRPFISNDRRVVNAGSWVTDAEIHDTFVEIEGDKIRICVFKDKDTILDITDTVTVSNPL
jgi:predicted phosphodiesterase